ncbi:MAG TPA: sensor histidine kinase [Candidatus Methylomirabilis sp.]|nr:sensor histidine kinase [Candidatus Methylomirabilis sp.]
MGGRKLFTITLHDVTAERESAAHARESLEQLRALWDRLLTLREEERARIAREVRDRLGQALAVLRMDLAWLAARLPAGEAALVARVHALGALATTAIQAARQIATDLRPGLLDDLGLVATLYWQAQEFQTRTGIVCECLAEEADIPLAPEARTVLFRLCQEALANVARHAHATQVVMRQQEEPGELSLVVADNGRGITEQEINNRTSLGLLCMRERARLLEGEVTIVGVPGIGTTVRVRVPLPASSRQDADEEARRPDRLLDPAT